MSVPFNRDSSPTNANFGHPACRADGMNRHTTDHDGGARIHRRIDGYGHVSGDDEEVPVSGEIQGGGACHGDFWQYSGVRFGLLAGALWVGPQGGSRITVTSPPTAPRRSLRVPALLRNRGLSRSR
jgi:hypothetical protein